MLTYSEVIQEKPTSKIHVGFPTLHRYDLLTTAITHLLNGSRPPDSILVVDNGGEFKFRHQSVTVLRPGYNLGVSASWNLIYKYFGGEDVVIMNDDIAVGRRTIEWLSRVPGWFITAYSYGCFLRRKLCREVVGEFDEFLWPMYWEDCDYDLRMIRAIDNPNGDGVEVLPGLLKGHGGLLHICNLPDADCHHVHGGSQTKQGWMGPWEHRIRVRFHRKWGALHRTEAPHQLPFQGSPDDPFRDYLEECYGNAGFVPYMDKLTDLAIGCTSAIETLADVGRWTMCLLHAGVKEIYSYAWIHSPEWDYLPRLAQLKETKLKLVSGYNPFEEIPRVDLLFINEESDIVTKIQFMKQHEKVQKHIVFLGENDLNCPARDKFREFAFPSWYQAYHLNGMTVFSRKP